MNTPVLDHARTTAPPRLPALTHSVLQVLYQHRMMTTDQLKRLLLPHAAGATYLRRQLRAMHAAGLVERARTFVPRPSTATGWAHPPRRAQYLWYLTETAAEAVEVAGELPVRPYRVTSESVAGPRQAHTAAVNETGLAFAAHAARLGHECGPLDWAPEVAHRIRDGQRRFEDDHVIADAVLHYVDVRQGRRRMVTLFLEVDRATMTAARLAAKISAYGRLYEYAPEPLDRARRGTASAAPAWQATYPVFPRLLVVLDGEPSATLATRLAARTEDLYVRTRADPRLARLTNRVHVGVTTLRLLQEHGPFEPIFTPLLLGSPERRPPLTDLYLRPPG
ncbi:MAG: replication-relaxation family protein [Streptomycetaceae bacterium]|nr:replication-relaxation family protein [Streptomycetaceae bacterium]